MSLKRHYPHFEISGTPSKKRRIEIVNPILPPEIITNILRYTERPVENILSKEFSHEYSTYLEVLRLEELESKFPQWRIHPEKASLYFTQSNNLYFLKLMNPFIINPLPYKKMIDIVVEKGNINLFTYLLSQIPKDIFVTYRNDIIRKLTQFNHVPILQWIHQVFGLTSEDIDIIMTEAALNHNRDLMNWVISIFPSKQEAVNYVAQGAILINDIPLYQKSLSNGAHNLLLFYKAALQAKNIELMNTFHTNPQFIEAVENEHRPEYINSLIEVGVKTGDIMVLSPLIGFLVKFMDLNTIIADMSQFAAEQNKKYIIDWLFSNIILVSPTLTTRLLKPLVTIGDLDRLKTLNLDPDDINIVAVEAAQDNKLSILLWALDEGTDQYIYIFDSLNPTMSVEDIKVILDKIHRVVLEEEFNQILFYLALKLSSAGRNKDLQWVLDELNNRQYLLNLPVEDYQELYRYAFIGGYGETIETLMSYIEIDFGPFFTIAVDKDYDYIISWLLENFVSFYLETDGYIKTVPFVRPNCQDLLREECIDYERILSYAIQHSSIKTIKLLIDNFREILNLGSNFFPNLYSLIINNRETSEDNCFYDIVSLQLLYPKLSREDINQLIMETNNPKIIKWLLWYRDNY